MKKLFSIFLMSSVTCLVSCSKNGQTDSGAQAINSTQSLDSDGQYAAEDYFRGVVFGGGSVAAYIPNAAITKVKSSNFTDENGEIGVRMQNFQNLMISVINQQRPEFLDSFKTIVTSGDLYLIDELMPTVGEVIGDALTSIYDLTQPDNAAAFQDAVLSSRQSFTGTFGDLTQDQMSSETFQQDLRYWLGNHQSPSVYSVAAVAVAAVGVVWVLLVAQNWVYVDNWMLDLAVAPNQLSRENLVAEIATNLRTKN